MASSSKIGDLVWAKMKGFPAWPGKIIEPKVEFKKSTRKNQHFVFFFGSENYAWIHEDQIFPYLDFKSRFLLTSRIPKGFKEAVEAIEDCVKALPKQTSYKVSELPSIDEELKLMCPWRSPKGKDSQSGKKRKNTTNTDPEYKSKAAVPKDRRSSSAKRKVSKDKGEEVKDVKSVNSVIAGQVGVGTPNGRPSRRSSRGMSSEQESAKQTDSDQGLYGKKVVPYEQFLASEEISEHKVAVDNTATTGDAQGLGEDLFAEAGDVIKVSGEIDSENGAKEETAVNIYEDDRQRKGLGDSEADNLFEKLGFGSLEEPTAEEMFDEMMRASTPSAKSTEDSQSQSVDDTVQLSASPSHEVEPLDENTEPMETTEEQEPMSPLKLSSTADKPKTPTIALTGKKLTPKRASSPSTTPAPKKQRILEKASPKVTTTPKPIARTAVAASSSDSKPAAGISADACPAVGEAPPKTIIATPAKIGFLGLGIMGQGMVSNLLKSGHEVTVWNRTASKCREFVKEGALKGNSPAEVVGQCDITFSCVSDPQALKDLVFGNCGVLQGIVGSKKSFVDMSTVDVETVIDIHDAVMARGGRFLEAPVIGSRGPAQNGELIILSAGDLSLHEDCFSCFQAMGRKTLYLGDIGNAARMKLVANMLVGTMAAALAESMALAEKIGLDQAELLRVLMMSDVASSLVESKGSAIMNSKFETNFPLQHQQKDLRLAIDMADSVDQPMHVIAAANELFKKAKAKGYGEHDMSAVYRAADM